MVSLEPIPECIGHEAGETLDGKAVTRHTLTHNEQFWLRYINSPKSLSLSCGRNTEETQTQRGQEFEPTTLEGLGALYFCR